MIILDIGSGSNQHQWEEMIDEVAKRDTRQHEIVFKAQLFEDIPPNTPADRGRFTSAQGHALHRGYKMTASVYDTDSLQFLIGYSVPFVKIACRPDLYWLMHEVPSSVPTYVSVSGPHCGPADKYLLCVPKYPATMQEYTEKSFFAYDGVSDHTVGLELYRTLEPKIFEKHLALPDSVGPDAGPFSITPDQLESIL